MDAIDQMYYPLDQAPPECCKITRLSPPISSPNISSL